MVPCRRLLILSCSNRKRTNSDPLSALDRYDGPSFRVLRKYLREHPRDAQILDSYVLSAEFGLFPITREIPNYNRRMTAQRAKELNAQIMETFNSILQQTSYQKLLINAGKDYLLALSGYQLLVPDSLQVTVSAGTQGRKLSVLHDWLYGTPPESSHHREQRAVFIRGVQLLLTSEEILRIARQALSERRGNPEDYRSWYVVIDDRRVSPKWLISQLTGLPVSAFVTDEARRVLVQLGIEVLRV